MDPSFKIIILDVLRSYPEIELAIVYGSAGSGRMSNASDVDVAVAAENPLAFERLHDLYQDLVASLSREVDLKDLHSLSGLILKQILSGGRVIVNRRPELLARFMLRNIYYQEDMAPNVRMIQEANAKRFARGQ